MFHSQGALGSVVRNAPKDYDIVFVNQPLFTGGKLFSRFGDFTGHTVQLHEWEQRGVVGLGTYLFSNRFVDTVRIFFVHVRACVGNCNDDVVFLQQVFKHVAKHGADDLDWWLVDRMCTADSVNANGDFVGFDDAADATRPMLRCYHALGVLDEGENGGLTFKKHEGRKGKAAWEKTEKTEKGELGRREGSNPLGLRGKTYSNAAEWIVTRAKEVETVKELTAGA